MRMLGRWCLLLGACVLLGCAPALNWRALPFPGAPLRMQLPCKPDKAEREVEMAGRKVALQMQGCEADGAMFAVSHVAVEDAQQAAAVLTGWKQAVLSHLGATDVRERSWAPPGGWQLPQSLRLQARTAQAGQPGPAAEAVWFARAAQGRWHLFHAIVLTRAPRPEVAETFFSGLVLPSDNPPQ